MSLFLLEMSFSVASIHCYEFFIMCWLSSIMSFFSKSIGFWDEACIVMSFLLCVVFLSRFEYTAYSFILYWLRDFNLNVMWVVALSIATSI